MRERSLDDDLIEKVVNYYDYLWSRQGALDEEIILNELPPSLRQEVSVHINRYIIDSVPFFCNCENSTQKFDWFIFENSSLYANGK
jgi:hypothetical protein